MFATRLGPGGCGPAPAEGPVVLRHARAGRCPQLGSCRPRGIAVARGSLCASRDRGGPWYPVALAIPPSASRSSPSGQMEAWRMLVPRHHVSSRSKESKPGGWVGGRQLFPSVRIVVASIGREDGSASAMFTTFSLTFVLAPTGCPAGPSAHLLFCLFSPVVC